MKELIKLCKEEGISGKNIKIDKYYVMFEFRPLKEKCKECGKEI